MSFIRSKRGIALIVVVGLAAAVWIGSAVSATPAPPSLPQVTAQHLLTDLVTKAGDTKRPPSFSATASSNVDLGLPTPPVQLGGSSGPLGLLIGQQSYKVWSSPDGLRVANILPFGERDLVVNRSEAWLWDSERNAATRLTYDLAAMQRNAESQMQAGEQQTGTPPDPATLAEQVLQRLAPYATLSVTTNQWVAGQPCYTLVLTPTSQTTLIGSIQVAVDANNLMPLQLEVFARGSSSPSVQIGFTSIDFASVDPAMFSFSPPAGAKVETKALPAQPPSGPSSRDTGVLWHGPLPAGDTSPQLLTFGTGFDTVLAYKPTSPIPSQYAGLLPYEGPLASVMVVQHGGASWLLAGAVAPSVLQQTVSHLP